MEQTAHNNGLEIAIIGLAGRFPGAKNVEEFWHNVLQGKETLSFFSDEELSAAGVDRAQLQDPGYVKVNGVVRDADLFDASFFGYSPREAELIDPQQRIFLECAEEALEHAGYDSHAYHQPIGVYASVGISTYFLYNVYPHYASRSTYALQEVIANDKDFLASRVAYKLNLQGPGVVVQSACSSSLVAVHLACQSLLSGECHMVLAGGVSIRFPQEAGYRYQEGSIASPDGHCRAFDAQAQGTTFGNGVGIVVLKRLEDALAEGDTIHAVIKGSAINNDGSAKVGYTAPSIQGQAKAIKRALLTAEVAPETISYIEAHGTGTPVGDPIEIAALKQAFGKKTSKKQFCAISSVKTNIGHLDAAAGIAGLIKTVGALKYRLLPPSLHFQEANPALDLANSPFYVNTTATPWWPGHEPRRAGVSSFGIGGTNAHVVLEEAPEATQNIMGPSESRILVLSARSGAALQQARQQLAAHLEQHPEQRFADVVYTLQLGRREFAHRLVAVCQDRVDALQVLGDLTSPRLLSSVVHSTERPVIFLFPGQGAQYVRMGRDLYLHEPIFRGEIDRCAELLVQHLGLDIRTMLFPVEITEQTKQQLDQTWLTQPALFVVEYALAKLWQTWGIQPAACIGHSIGEYVAACLANVFTLEDALWLVALRGRLMQQAPGGAMLAVSLSEQQIQPLLNEQVGIAAINAPNQCVVAGTTPDIAMLAERLQEQGVDFQRLHTSHAFHSRLVDSVLPLFADYLKRVELHSPRMPYLSSVTGTWITAAQATDPEYWVQQLRQPVRFADGVRELLGDPDRVFLEVGPGHTLSTFVRQQFNHSEQKMPPVLITSLPRAKEAETLSDQTFLLASLGRLWLAGVDVEWSKLHLAEQRRRVPLPTYPFERQRYWMEPPVHTSLSQSTPSLSPQSVDGALISLASEVDQREQQTVYARPNLATSYIAPRTQLEQTIAEIWQVLLGVDKIGVFDDFYQLGGHSLLATQLVSRLRTTLHIEIPLRDVLEVTNVAELVERVETQQAAQRSQQELAMVAVSRTEQLSLSSAQQRLWLLCQLERNNAFYNVPIVLSLQGKLDREILRRSLQMIIDRHEILRTVFREVDGQPIQIIRPGFALELPLVDLQSLTAQVQEHERSRLATEEAQRLFSLADGPLFRAVLLRLHEREHILLATMHHIISDGWSMGVFGRELAAIYVSLAKGKLPQLGDLPIQYADYAAWQQRRLQEAMLASQLTYWQEQLSGELPVLELPYDYPRPPVQTYRGAHQHFLVSQELTEQLRAVCQKEDVTLFMLLFAAFQVLLFRYSAQEDISVGIPIANRNRTETEELIGLFVNTLVLRCSLSGNPDFRTFLQQVRKVCLDAYAHQDVPFDKLVEVCRPERDLSRSPLFQVMFALQNAPQPPMHFQDLSLSRLETESGIALFDLTMELVETEHALRGTVEYNIDLFKQSTVERMIASYLTLLEEVVANSDQYLSKLSLLSERERQQILVAWNNTQVARDTLTCFHRAFEAQVERTPDALALVHKNNFLSYHMLNQRANQLAHYLRACEVRPGVRVGICVERSLEMVIGLIGILKAGGTYVPLDPAYPQKRLEVMVESAKISTLITQSHLSDTVFHQVKHVVYLDIDQQAIAQEQTTNLTSEVSVEDLAYVIFTSGSTGQPKGAGVYQRGFMNLLHWFNADFQIGPTDKTLLMTSLNFDLTQKNIFAPLLVGGAVCLPASGYYDVDVLRQCIAEEAITLLNCTPSMFYPFVDDQDSNMLNHLKSLRCVFLGGEPIAVQRLQKWVRFSNYQTEVVNTYGPTECSDVVSFHRLSQEKQFLEASAPIGCPIANTQLIILDKNLQVVPPTIPGELCIAGECVGAGYVNDEELAATKFIANPFSEIPSTLLYRTGDLACYREDGTIEYRGRQDQQVKVRGVRIELAEIEHVLLEHETVRECVVIVGDMTEGKPLIAYVVGNEGQELPATPELRRHLQERLPNHMIPSYFVQIEAIPLTSNGKVDRRALPAPDWREEQADGDRRRLSLLEELVGQVWCQVLQRVHIDVQANFFEIGGHSLLATQVIARLHDMLGIEIPLRILFETPNLSRLAERLHHLQMDNQGQEIPAILPVARNQDLPLPLSFAQQRLWFLDQLEPGSTAYTIPSAFRLRGQLNRSALGLALHIMILRHENLRTTFPSYQGEPQQRISPESLTRFMLLDLLYLPPMEREEQARRLVQQEIEVPFNLADGPLLRCKLLQIAEEEHVLLLTMHHIISDGWSSEILVRELSKLYTALQNAEAFPLPALSIQYADYALWQRSWLQGAVLERQLAYWKAQLAELSPLDLPTDQPRPALQTFKGARQPVQVSAELSQALRALSQREGVTLFMTLMAAFQVLLARYSGQMDIAVGTPIANRTRREIEGVIGCFVNTLVLRTNLADNPSFIDLLKRVRTTALEAYTYQDVPFEQIVEAVQSERDQSRTPLFQVMFVLQNVTTFVTELSALQVEQFQLEQHTTKFDMHLELVETEQGLSGAIEYNTDLFEEATIRRLIKHFQTLLEGIVHAPLQRVLALPLLSANERDQILRGWNHTDTIYPEAPSLLHQLVEAQVARTPDAVALIFEDDQLTYHVLDQRAEHLAQNLRHLGVAADVLVGVCMERSLELVLALLAVLKAGGAYVPLDPGYPQERLAYLLTDTQVNVLLTQSHLSERFPEREGLRVLCLDQPFPLVQPAQAVSLLGEPQPHHLAYMIYTSGSTGQPKGAMNTHEGISNRLLWMQEQYRLTSADRVLQKTPSSFDVSVWEFFWPLLAGASLLLAVPEGHKDPGYLKALIQERGVTTLHFVPAMLQAFLDEAGTLRGLEVLRQVMCSGEALSAELQKQFFDRMPKGVRLHNLYGPTEAAVDVTFWECQRASTGGTVPIGTPIANTQMYVLDASLEPVPVGAVGELYIGGVGLARGYWRRAELTADQFVPDSWSRTAGGRLYKTGDLARYQPDGTLEYLGRADAQVKLRGYRIELGEIESVLLEHPGVKQCVVVLQGASLQDKRLVAYVVAQQGASTHEVSARALRSYLKSRLPEYMVPALFVLLVTLPLTPNGKVDRRALPVADGQSEQEGSNHVQCSPLEELVGQVWQEVLRREQIGSQDDFFEIGGHSLLATQVIARLREMLGIEIPLRILFEASTLSGLTAHLQQYLVQGREQEIPAIRPVSRDQALPLSFAQQRLWFLHLLMPDSSAYNMSGAVRLRGNLDVSALRVAFLTLVQRHESLRTTFAEQDGQVVQHIEIETVAFFPFFDLSGSLSSERRTDEMKYLIQQETQKPFDLVCGPLSRLLLLKLDQSDYICQLTMHHIISDGWSMSVLIRELITLYQAFKEGEPSSLAPLAIQYVDYACWQRQWLQGEVLKEQIRYWTHYLSEARAIELPTDYPRTPLLTTHGSKYHIQLDTQLTQALKQLSRQEGVTLFMTLLAAFQVLLYRLTGEEDIVVGTDSANRSDLQTEGLVGFFVNLLALRAHVPGKPPFHDFLHEIRKTVIEAYMHQELPFDVLIENIHQAREGNRTPLVNVLFVMQNVPSIRVELPDLVVSQIDLDATSAKFELALFVAEEAAGLDCSVDYNTDLFERATVERMMNSYIALLRDILAHPASPIDQLEMSTEEQKQLHNDRKKKSLKQHLNKLKDFKGDLIDLS